MTILNGFEIDIISNDKNPSFVLDTKDKDLLGFLHQGFFSLRVINNNTFDCSVQIYIDDLCLGQYDLEAKQNRIINDNMEILSQVKITAIFLPKKQSHHLKPFPRQNNSTRRVVKNIDVNDDVKAPFVSRGDSFNRNEKGFPTNTEPLTFYDIPTITIPSSRIFSKQPKTSNGVKTTGLVSKTNSIGGKCDYDLPRGLFELIDDAKIKDMTIMTVTVMINNHGSSRKYVNQSVSRTKNTYVKKTVSFFSDIM